MSVVKKYLQICLCLFLFICGTVSRAQNVEKEPIYISFENKPGFKKVEENNTITFLMNSEQFVFDARKNSAEKIRYTSIRDSLISLSDAKGKIFQFLEGVAKEKLKEARDSLDVKIIQFLKRPGIYYYNSYFKNIYVFEKTNSMYGILYPVKWNWYVE